MITSNNVLIAMMKRTNLRKLHSAIPKSVVTHIKPASNKAIIDSATIKHLERISLVDFANVRGIERLESAIDLAELITDVDTAGVEPLYSVLEEETLYLRPDVPVDPDNRDELLSLASLMDEDYYVAPQGNVPLSSDKTYERS